MADIDFDGEKEILYQGGDFNAYIHLRGGSLFELDSLKTLCNYASVMSLPDPAGKRSPSRRCFQDRFTKAGGFGQELGNCFDAYYGLEDSDRPAHLAVLTREAVLEQSGRRKTVFLRKKYAFRKVALAVTYEIANRENETLSFRFCSELNLAAGHGPEAVALEGQRNGNEKTSFPTGNKAAASGLDLLRIINLEAEEHVELRSDRPFELVSMPVFQNVALYGKEARLYQGASLLLGWDLSIPADSSVRISLNLEIRP
jgi:hypothetical protein